MNKSFPSSAKRLSDLIGKPLADAFKRQGFASREIVTRWPEIAGAEIAAHAEPVRMQWPRQAGTDQNEPATLVLRVDGPAAIEIQHLSGLIIERVNRFFGWQAIDRLALRQAPLMRRPERRRTTALLRKRGVEVVDAPPESFAPAVADTYLSLKAAGRL